MVSFSSGLGVESRQNRCGLFPPVVLLLIVAFGCGKQPDPTFVASEEAVTELSATHQQQIDQRLGELFGTPVNPRLQVPADGEVDEEGNPVLVDLVDPARLQHGAQVFNLQCAGCHGTTGDGNGVAAAHLQPKPRDYRRGVYKFTSTPYGAKPARSDLVRVVRWGAKGTSMPAFRFLPEEDVQAVVDYVTMLSYRGELERAVAQAAAFDYDEDEEIEDVEFLDSLARIHNTWQQASGQVVLPVTAEPRYSDETILAGRKAFLTRGCSKCHGDKGEGQIDWLSHEFIAEQEALPEEKRIKINYDAWGHAAPAADLTAGMLHGGRRPIDIYRRIYTGINGTPMPAFSQALAEEPETIWHMVHYVMSVVEGRDVPGLDEIEASPLEGEAVNTGD